MIRKSKKQLRGGMVRAGSVQHFRRGKGISKSRRTSKKRSISKGRRSISNGRRRSIRGGMVRSGSVQHFRRGKH
jgi:hypothetical protein